MVAMALNRRLFGASPITLYSAVPERVGTLAAREREAIVEEAVCIYGQCAHVLAGHAVDAAVAGGSIAHRSHVRLAC